ncbi:hypothetical protein IWQ60_000434 [Tieghemiomyces parasiticus]|uniref:sphingolipid C(9)-methyltransferase n=1 Tax=Tieghemiomyces parasiticus TaxID=78921 RepID=A0A9W8AL77_9FUNG|nr:hypothetical protein IWQ60_000434 [Tieghemiomyces parasiticus]
MSTATVLQQTRNWVHGYFTGSSHLTLVLTIMVAAFVVNYLVQYFAATGKVPAAQHLVPTSSNYPSTAYTKARKIPFYTFLNDFMANRVEIRKRDGYGLSHWDESVTFPLTLRSLWTFTVQVLPTYLWHSRAANRAHWRRFYDQRDDLFECLMGRLRLSFTPRFIQSDESLAEAQTHDIGRLTEEDLALTPDDRVLNLDTQWGTVELCWLSRLPLYIHSTSHSVELAQYAQTLAERASADDRVQFHTQDFRDLTFHPQQFTKILALESADWIGQKHLPDFFRTCHDLLAPGGRLVIHSTTSPSVFGSLATSSVASPPGGGAISSLFSLLLAPLSFLGGRTGASTSASATPTGLSHYLHETFHYHLFCLTKVCPGRDTVLFTTLADYVAAIQSAGLEIVRLDNLSQDASKHYAEWFANWDHHRARIEMRYGEDIYRQMELYLAWTSSLFRRGGLQRHLFVLQRPFDNNDA